MHLRIYCNNPKYCDRHVSANSVDLAQISYSAASDKGLHCFLLIELFLDKLTDSQIVLLKF